MSEHKYRLETFLLVAVGLAGAVILYGYLRATGELNRRYDVPLTPLQVEEGPAIIAEGERQARVRGCFWCHGQQLEGQKYFAEYNRGIIAVAPDLTRVLANSTPAEFARTVRHGVKPDGTSLQPAMPSFAFYNMSDADMGAIIAYIRSLPMRNGLEGRFDLLPVGWYRWLKGELPPNVADLIDHTAARPDPALGSDPVARGRYLAESICTECHGDNGRIRVALSPNLEITAAYSKEEFVRLMRSGVPKSERKIDYHMVDASKYRYTLLTDPEVDALYAYFRALVPGVADRSGP